MSENEREFTEQERQHQKLCAYILDEATAEDRAEIERALEVSAELRDERSRLEATIGMVKTSLSGPLSGTDALPVDVTAKLIAAADRKRRPWFVSPPVMRIAAGLLILTVGFGAWSAWQGREAAEDGVFSYHIFGSSETTVASVDKKAEKNAAQDQSAAGDDARRLKGLGYDGGSGDTSNNISTSPSGAPAPAANGPTPFEQFDALTQSGNSEAELWGEGALEARFSYAQQNPPVGGKLDEVQPRARLAEIKQQEEHGIYALGSTGGAAPASTPAPAEAPPAIAWTASGVGQDGVRYGGRGGSGRLIAKEKAAAVSEPGLAAGLETMRLAHSEYLPDRAKVTPTDTDVLLGLRYPGGDADDEGKGAGNDDFRFGGRKQRSELRFSPEEIDRRCDLFIDHCRRRTNERPRDMFFRFWGDNPFEVSQLDKLSTFSVDVDTASYTLARKYLVDGYLPQKEQVRTEEFLNYFKPDLQAPRESTFAIYTELAPSLFSTSPNTWMLRVGIRGKEVSRTERQPLALTFVIDRSGSMKEGGRLELVKHTLRLLLAELDPRDSISIVSFSNDASLNLPMTSAAQGGLIESALNPLQPDGGTNTEAGLRMGYEQAVAAITKFSHNRVVLLTDGVANIGITDPNALTASVERQRKAGIYLNTIGVGMNNHNDTLLEQLADKGDGLCNYVDDEKEARRALVDNFTGAFEPIARDVKVQVEFDPAQVERYRLLGYENRAVADADFRNDAVDAGEVNAGHQVIALYEIVRTGGGDGPLAKVNLRWKAPHRNGVAAPGNEEASEVSKPVFSRDVAGSYAATSPGYRRSVLVAQFAEFLRRSFHARGDSLDTLIAEASKLDGELKDSDFSEFVQMVAKSKALVLAEQSRFGDLERCCEQYRHNCYLRAQLDDFKRDSDRELMAQLERQNLELEAKIRDLLRQRLGQHDPELRQLGYTDKK